MAVCPNCGKDNQPQYKFCLGCGGELATRAGDSAARPLPTRPEQTTLTGDAPRSPGTAPPVFGDMGPPEEPPAKRRCPTCGTQVAPGFRFCPSCGGPMEAKDAPQKAQVVHPQQLVQGRMILMRPDGTEGGVHLLKEGENLIGRIAGPLFEADGYLSPKHAQIVLNAAGAVVRDLGSLNGVFVKIFGDEELQDGDIFRIGQELLRMDLIPAPEPLEDGTEVLGSPNPGYWGRLALIVGKDQDGSAFPMSGDVITLGRERGDFLFPEDGYVSGTHARVVLRDGRCFLSDLNSSNGSFVRIRGERPVPSGSFVLMGQQLFRVVY